MSRKLVLMFALLLTLASLAGAQMINEFLYDTQGTDDPNIMFVEIWGPPGFDLSGWSLVGVNGNGGVDYLTVPLDGSIPDDGYFVVGGAGVANVDQVVTADFQNAGSSSGDDCDGIDLRNGEGQVIDHICYGNCAAGHVCTGEGSCNAPDYNPPSQGPNKSLVRVPDHQDTGSNCNDFQVTETLTPGAPNSGSPCSPHYASLSDIRLENGQNVPTLLDTFVVTRGVVNVQNFVFDSLTLSKFYFQDEDAGVSVFRISAPADMAVGDCVVVSGWINQFNGLTEISYTGSGNCIPSVDVVAHTDPPSPTLLTCSSPMESFEGMLAEIDNVTIVSGTWPSQGQYSTNLIITDGTGTIELSINKWTNVDGSPQPQGAFNVLGIISQYDASAPYNDYYEIMPRSVADIHALSADDQHNASNVRDFRLEGAYPNPFNSVTQIHYEVGSTRELTLRIFDLMGREVSRETLSGLTPGAHTYSWSPNGATGLYFVRLESAGRMEMTKALYLK